MKNRANRFLLAAFLLSLAAYIIIFAACFVDLPIGIPPWHQFLLLYAHSIPMFCLQLLLCGWPGHGGG